MVPIFQPVNQIRLTNVAVVRLKRHGHRFEVACYKNKVLNWRSGIETDIDEVLQSHTVFHNVSKGEYAKRELLAKAFGTTDEEQICRWILDKGELQVSDKEREAALDAIFKDVATLVTEYTVNPQTGMPLTRSMIEGAIRDIGFSLRVEESAKKQALKVVDELLAKLPQQIGRALMRLRVTAAWSQREEVNNFLTKHCFAVTETQTPVSAVFGANTTSTSGNTFSGMGYFLKPTLKESFAESSKSDVLYEELANLNLTDKETEGKIEQTAASSASSTPYKVVFMCYPKYYRSIDEFVLKQLKPPGTLQLLTSSVKGFRDFAASSPDTIDDVKQSSGQSVSEVGIIEPEYTRNTSTKDASALKSPNSPHETQKGIRCTVCMELIQTRREYPLHCKSERHCYNLKRKMEHLDPVTSEEYNQLVAASAKNGVLRINQ